MRQLFPVPMDDVDVDATYAADRRTPGPHRPWLLLNMIAGLDGATAVEGVSGGLGGPTDKAAFRAIRALPDVILVAAGTVRAEHYGPVRLTPEQRTRRVARGQAPLPRLAVVTARVDLDPASDPFQTDGQRPLVVTVAEPAPDATAAEVAARHDRLEAIRSVADVLEVGTGRVDLPATLQQLRAGGTEVVLGEGGPSLNGALIEAGLVDELCLSLSPTLVAGDSARVAHAAGEHPTPMRLDRVLEGHDLLLLRYTVAH